jgi:hypothetical protein
MTEKTRREFINRTIAAGGSLAAVQLAEAIGGAGVAKAASDAAPAVAAGPRNDPGPAQPTWRELVDFLHDADTTFLDQKRGQFDEFETAYGYRSLVHMLMSSVNIFMEMDPDRPEFVQLDTRRAPLLGGNPDTRYDWAALRGGKGYRITGQRGDECYLSFTTNRGDPGAWLRQRLDDNINHHAMKFDADGRFEVIVSPERLGENWLKLSPDGCAVQARTYVLNRNRDRRATFTIEPLDPVPAPARLTREEVAQRLGYMADFIKEQTSFVVPRPPIGPDKINTVTRQPYRFKLGDKASDYATPDNVYGEGRFFLKPDEALVLEGVAVPSDYWGIQIWNPYLASPDYRYHKVSINKSEAKLGPKGEFRVAIVSGGDPKIPGLDWISAAGERQGTFYIRWLVSQAEPPNVTAKLVKIADLRG